jgi:hypothetical protein
LVDKTAALWDNRSNDLKGCINRITERKRMKAELIDGITGKEVKIGSITLSKGGIMLKNGIIQCREGYRLLNTFHGLSVQTLSAIGSTIHLPKMSEKQRREAVKMAKDVLGWKDSF